MSKRYAAMCKKCKKPQEVLDSGEYHCGKCGEIMTVRVLKVTPSGTFKIK